MWYKIASLSMNATAKIVGVTAQSVMRWIRQAAKEYAFDNHDVSQIKEVEMDEMYHYLEKKSKNMVVENY